MLYSRERRNGLSALTCLPQRLMPSLASCMTSEDEMEPLRSMLFVPGNKPAWMEKAAGYGADALIFDLEDAVPLAAKATARQHVRATLERLQAHHSRLTVRINPLETGLTSADLEAIVCTRLVAIVAPKVETPQDVAVLDSLLARYEYQAGIPHGQVEIFPTLETAKGIYHAYHIATSSPRIASLLGTAGKGGDTARSLGYSWSKDGTETLYIRSKILLEARAAGLAYPLMASWFDIADLEGLRADALLNRRLGYTGQVVIHPSHLPVLHEVFTPTAEEIRYYQGLMEAMAEAEQSGTAAVTYEGAMVDIAMVKTAQQILELATTIGLENKLEEHGKK